MSLLSCVFALALLISMVWIERVTHGGMCLQCGGRSGHRADCPRHDDNKGR